MKSLTLVSTSTCPASGLAWDSQSHYPEFTIKTLLGRALWASFAPCIFPDGQSFVMLLSRGNTVSQTHRHSLTSLTHSLTHSHTHTVTHTHSHTHSLRHSLTSLTDSLPHSHSLTHSLTHSLSYSLTQSLNHSDIQSLSRSVAQSLT